MKVFTVLLSAALLANHVRAASTSTSIIFPGAEESQPPQASQPRGKPRLVFKDPPKCARNPTGICSHTDEHQDYPADLVRKALGNANDAALSEITRGDEILLNTTLGNRFGGSVHDDNNLVEETAACAASEEIIYPTMAMNSKKEWLYVANVETMTQGIRVEKCLDEGKPCKIGEAGTTCRQKYIYRKLIAMDANQNLEADNFRIPSTCVCYIKNEYLITTRFKGNNRNSTKSTGSSKRRGRSRSSRSRRRSRRQAAASELEITGGETDGLSGSPLDTTLAGGAAEQGTAQQSIETEDTLNPSDTIGQQKVRWAGEIVVDSNPIVVLKKPPKSSRRRN